MHARTAVTAILACALIVALGLISFTATSDAQQQVGPDWSRLEVVAYPSGVTGFFDPATGKLYVYDDNIEQCILVRQLEELGKPMKDVKRSTRVR